MAKADIGPKIGIDGEAEFRRQIQDIANGVKTLGSEMQVVTSEYARNENSVEALTAKNDVLDRTISSLNEKLAAQERMLAESANAYGEADSRTQKWQQAVNGTITELNNAKNAYAANEQQLEKLGSAGEGVAGLLKNGFSSLAESLTGKLGGALGLSSGQMKSLTGALTGGSGALGSLSAGSLAAAGAVGALGAAAVKAGAELVKLAEEAGRNADEVLTLATNYNMSAQDIQKFQYMAELTDTSVETVTGSISRLTRSMSDARDGTGDASDAFARLGISVTNGDGSLRSANEVFLQAIDALGSVGNATERDALAMEIFGKSAMDLNSLIATGSAGIAAYAREAENAGFVMSDQMLSALGAVDDAGVKLDNSMTALHNTLGAMVAPAVSTVKEGLADLIGSIAEGIQQLTGMTDSANTTADSMNNLAASIRGVRDLTAEDLLTDQQRSYKSYVDRALKYQQETGQQVTIYNPNALSDTRGYYQGGYNSGSVTLQLDGYTVGRAMTGSVNSRNYTRGSGL